MRWSGSLKLLISGSLGVLGGVRDDEKMISCPKFRSDVRLRGQRFGGFGRGSGDVAVCATVARSSRD